MGTQEESGKRRSAVWRHLSCFGLGGQNPTCCCRNSQVISRRLERLCSYNSHVIKEQSNGIRNCSSGSTNTKHKGCENEQEDRITQLPDSILIRILSLLPTEDSIKTILIPRFRNLWTFAHNLDFELDSYRNRLAHKDLGDWSVCEKFVNLVRQVLIRHDFPTIFKFRLRFSDDQARRTEFANEIDAWIGYVFRKEVNVLVLDFYSASSAADTEVCYKLPSYVLTSNCLTELELVHCGVNSWEEIHLGSLKSLSLSGILLGGDAIRKILFGCPWLQNLSLYKCCGRQSQLNITSQSLRSLKVDHESILRIKISCPLLKTLSLIQCRGLSEMNIISCLLLEILSLIQCCGMSELNITSPNLKNLVVVNDPNSRIEISCQYVTSINISGWIDGVALSNVSSLVDATLDLSEYSYNGNGEFREVRMILQMSHHVKVLTIFDRLILVLTKVELKRLRCPSSNWKCLILKTRLTKRHLPGIASLLRNSPSLEMLTLYIQPSNSTSCDAGDRWFQSYDIYGERFWNLEEQSFDYFTKHLKTVTLYGHVTESCVIHLVQFLLKSAMVLEKMVISSPKWNIDPNCQNDPNHQNEKTFDKMQEFSKKLSKFPRASTHAVILFT
ncbi:hypothetical protein L1049_024153 [Liquidambar formosana]|uniref:F-box/LRR-repeat protein 15/At3g58940/PEG3-like LRR domain-containing protein n=1 Tax=Liquidambar formosana TaxID=63359 RepID=A0AAP0S028_LIQFO